MIRKPRYETNSQSPQSFDERAIPKLIADVTRKQKHVFIVKPKDNRNTEMFNERFGM